jgi:cytochrome c oxidase subunit 2
MTRLRLNRRTAGTTAPKEMARARFLIPFACAVAVAGCGSHNRQSSLAPKSAPAHDISTLWWWMLAIAAIVFAGAVFLIVLSFVRRRREGLPILGVNEQATGGLVVLFGVVIPIVVLVGVFVAGNLVVLPNTDAPSARTTQMTIDVIGHQWWWEVRYPGTTAVTANEIHIPAHTRVNTVVSTADVIHSFWVPELNRKIDMLPNHPNRVLLYAPKPGQYRGQCAEYCGAQHANMAMTVYADPPGRFRTWLANMARPAAAPVTPAQGAGRSVFLSNACAGCHQLRGTAAHAVIGPDLTHLAGRSTLAALTIPNRPAELSSWIRDPQRIKPDNRMPGLQLSAADFNNLVAYLESLR